MAHKLGCRVSVCARVFVSAALLAVVAGSPLNVEEVGQRRGLAEVCVARTEQL